MNQAMHLYKLMILKMLDTVNFPLTNSQITEFLVKYKYSTYFEVQQTFSDLTSSGLILEEEVHHSTRYSITDGGEQLLTYYKQLLPEHFLTTMQTYLQENKLELRNKVSAVTGYTPSPDGEFAVHCGILEKGSSIFDMTLFAPTEELAEKMCFNWEKKQAGIYSQIMQELIEED